MEAVPKLLLAVELLLEGSNGFGEGFHLPTEGFQVSRSGSRFRSILSKEPGGVQDAEGNK